MGRAPWDLLAHANPAANAHNVTRQFLHLYKYRSLSDEKQHAFVKDILLNNRLYWPSPTQFNDPFDCFPVPRLPAAREERERYARDLVQRVMPGASRVDRKMQLREILRDNLARIEASAPTIVRERIAQVGVCSFGEDCHNVLMWSHYADAHRGVCLRFSPSRFDMPLWAAFPVEYSEERPELRLASRDMKEWSKSILLTKAKYWEYEREWRVIDVEQVGHHPFRPGVLDEIILGAAIERDSRSMVLKWVRERASPTRIMQARFDEERFLLHVDPAPENEAS